MDAIMDFLTKTISISTLDIPMWAIIAVAAVVLVLVIVLICVGAKSSKSKKGSSKAVKAVAQESKVEVPIADEAPQTIAQTSDAEVDPIAVEKPLAKPELKDIATNEVESPKVAVKSKAQSTQTVAPVKKAAPVKVAVEEAPVEEEKPVVQKVAPVAVAPVEEEVVEETVVEETVAVVEEEPVAIEPVVVAEPVVEQPVAAADKVEEKPVAKKVPPKAPVKKAAPKAAAKPAPKAVAPKAAAPKAAPAPVEAEATTEVKKAHPIILLSDMPADATKGKYIIVKDDANTLRPYRYVLKANNGQVLFESEGYKIKPRAKQIEAFRKTLIDGTSIIDSEKNGTFRFKLYNKEDKLFGVGEAYKSKSAAENACESVKAFAESANFIEDTTVEIEE